MPQLEQKKFRIWLAVFGRLSLLILSFYISYAFAGISMDPIGFRVIDSIFVYILAIALMITLAPFFPRIVTSMVFMSGTITLLLLTIFLFLRFGQHELSSIQIHLFAGIALIVALLIGILRKPLEIATLNRAAWISITMVAFSVFVFELLPKPISS